MVLSKMQPQQEEVLSYSSLKAFFVVTGLVPNDEDIDKAS